MRFALHYFRASLHYSEIKISYSLQKMCRTAPNLCFEFYYQNKMRLFNIVVRRSNSLATSLRKPDLVISLTCSLYHAF